MYGHAGLAGECAYDASKGGIINLTRQVAVEFARDGARVKVVGQSDCDTPMITALFEPGADPDRERRRLGQVIPMGRIARAEEVAAAVAFLASDDASLVAGSRCRVDGGFLAQ